MKTDITIKFARLPHGMVSFYQHWMPRTPLALVVYVHDLGDHIGRYQRFIGRLVECGLACALFDQRGHGRSGGKRGHVERFMDWVDDLASFIQFSSASLPPETPVFIVGHGLGALTGINYLLTHASPIAGMVALNAVLSPVSALPLWKQRATRKLSRFLPECSINSGMRLRDLMHDEAERCLMEADPLVHRRVSLNALQEITRNIELVGGLPQRIYVPMLMLAGADDTFCDPEGTVWFAKRLASVEKQYHLYPGMGHDLLHDGGYEQVTDDVVGWVLEHACRVESAASQYSLNRREALWEHVSDLSLSSSASF